MSHAAENSNNDSVDLTTQKSESVIPETQNGHGEWASEHTAPAPSQVIDHIFVDVVFYLNHFLGASRIARLESLLFRYGAFKTRYFGPQDDTDWDSNTSKTTHIITDDFDFPDQKHAAARGIHIVTPQWVIQSVKHGFMQPPELYSADPEMIFSGVVIAATGIPQFDRQIISESVRNFGGRFENGITTEVTHLIALAPTGDKYNFVMDHPELEIKVVLPHWFQLCCNLKRRFPEDPDYTVNQQDVVQTGAPQLFSNSVRSVVAFLNTPNPDTPQFLKGLHFILANDLHVLPELRECFIARIAEAGGAVLSSEADYACDMVDVVICRFRNGTLYLEASKDGKTVASADWLLHVLQTGTIPSPKASLLHYPIPAEPIVGMTDHVLSISNYTGPIREYLKRMIVAVGATYKPTMSSRTAPEPTSHLVCGNAYGEKYQKGQEWNIKVVNHLWLEDCFQTWTLQSEAKQRYTHFPAHNQLSQVFGTRLSPQEIDDWIEDLTETSAVKAESSSPHVPMDIERSRDEPVVDGHGDDIRAREEAEEAPAIEKETEEPKSEKASTNRGKKALAVPVENTSVVSDPYDTSKDESSHPSTPSPTKPTAHINKEASPTPAGGPRIARMRGAALEASKALKKIVPDMNNFQEELQNEKKAQRKRKKAPVDDGLTTRKKQDSKGVEDEGDEEEERGGGGDEQVEEQSETEMQVDYVEVLSKKPASPTKKRKTTVQRKGSVSASDEESAKAVANSSREVGPPAAKKGKKSTAAATTAASAAQRAKSPSLSPVADENRGPSKEPRVVRYLCTGLKDSELTSKEIKQLKALGMVAAKSVDDCTHLVATHAARTEKFLCAVAQAKFIVRREYLNSCIEANAILDENEYRLEDPEHKNEYDVKLYQALDRAKEKKVFENCVFYISPSTTPKMAILKQFVEVGGGKSNTLLRSGLNFLLEKMKQQMSDGVGKSKSESKSNGRGVDNKNSDRDDDDDEDEDEDGKEEMVLVVVAGKEDKELWKPLQKAAVPVYSTELILRSMLQQQLDLEDSLIAQV
ncbi:hypothetical protein BGZ94_009578 [Podila epigama]|nr:hypothetical protein BGZ94_009578 [Podila epigama]